jgi:uncharacterized damage-inducible protein DinB
MASAGLVEDALLELRQYKTLADKALAGLDEAAFFRRPAEHVNPIALIVKHLAGNLTSRWTDFLTTDGEKPTRDRDSEFVLTPADTRASLLVAWDRGWQAVLSTVGSLTSADLTREITIRGEKHTVQQALLRGLNHAAYHVGQILYLARLYAPDRPWLTIAPGKSREHRPGYLRPGK